MAASATDYFQYVGDPGTATNLSSPGYTIGGTSITVASTTNWPTVTGVTFAIDEIDSSGLRVDGTYNVYRGTVASATSITNITWVKGDGDRNYSAGPNTRVYIPISSGWADRLVAGLTTSIDQDGTLKAGAVDNAAVLASDVVTTAKILDSNVTSQKLAEAFFRGRQQDITTNTAPTALTVQYGWSFIQGTGANTGNKTITFPTAFSSAPIVFIMPLGLHNSAPTAITDFAIPYSGNNAMLHAISVGTTSFSARYCLDSSATLVNTLWAGFTWIAIGTV